MKISEAKLRKIIQEEIVVLNEADVLKTTERALQGLYPREMRKALNGAAALQRIFPNVQYRKGRDTYVSWLIPLKNGAQITASLDFEFGWSLAYFYEKNSLSAVDGAGPTLRNAFADLKREIKKEIALSGADIPSPF